MSTEKPTTKDGKVVLGGSSISLAIEFGWEQFYGWGCLMNQKKPREEDKGMVRKSYILVLCMVLVIPLLASTRRVITRRVRQS